MLLRGRLNTGLNLCRGRAAFASRGRLPYRRRHLMTPLMFTLVTFASSVVAGVLGSLLGLGGGIIVVPVLTLLLHIDIRYAIGASIVSVIATSSGAAAAYVRERMTNLRVAMVLEIATTTVRSRARTSRAAWPGAGCSSSSA